jgi:hypothetical protein
LLLFFLLNSNFETRFYYYLNDLQSSTMRFSTIVTCAVAAVSGVMPAFALNARAPTLGDVLTQALKRADLEERRYAYDPTGHFHLPAVIPPNVRDLEARRYAYDPTGHFHIPDFIPANVRDLEARRYAYDPTGHFHIPAFIPPNVRDLEQRATFDLPHFRIGTTVLPGNRPIWPMNAVARDNQPPTAQGSGRLGDLPRPQHHHHRPGTQGQGTASQPVNARSWASRRASTIHSVNGKPYFILP